MNVRIEKLVSQSFTDEQGEHFDIEKFALLIVNDCIKIAEAGLAPAVVTVIKERFGVEQ